MSRIIYVGFDQLNVSFGALKTADKSRDHVVFVQSERMLKNRKWHKQRLQFLISSAKHFANELSAAGFQVTYLCSPTTVAGLRKVQSELGGLEIVCAKPNSYSLTHELTQIGVTFIENDFFLTPQSVFQSWAEAQKSFTMENFYRMQRKRLNVMMDGDQPEGGQWNFDAENRQPPPKQHDWGTALEFGFDEIDLEVLKEIPSTAWGNISNKYWGTSRAEALAQLDHFLENHFRDFGPFEDAMPNGSWAGHHSLLSPYLNNGLLHASEVVEAALERFSRGDIPIASCEGFIRQIVGWREYINGMYWFLGADYREHNSLNAKKDLLPLFHEPEKTLMNCVKTVVTDIRERGWTHHIPRLMVLSNLALVTGVSPQAFLDWMREVFIDAADWVMVPNVIGMATYADGGLLMTKPYAAGGSYISRMGQYCGNCKFDPKKRVGEDACPFTTLYWDFLARNAENFKKNHRMFQQMSGLNRLSDLAEVRSRADHILLSLEAGNC